MSNGKENQENKDILEKYLRIGPNKEMRERRKSGGIRPKREKRTKRKEEKKRENERKEKKRIKEKIGKEDKWKVGRWGGSFSTWNKSKKIWEGRRKQKLSRRKT